MEILKEKYTRI